jgi:hypothetical protein
MDIAKGISIRVDNTWKNFNTSCSCVKSAGSQVIVTGDYKICGAHDCINFVAQDKADEAAEMRIIAMKDGIIVVNNERDSQQRQDAFGKGWQPRKKFFFHPKQIEGT